MHFWQPLASQLVWKVKNNGLILALAEYLPILNTPDGILQRHSLSLKDSATVSSPFGTVFGVSVVSIEFLLLNVLVSMEV